MSYTTEYHAHHVCAANGCILPGVWSESIKGEGPWMCFIHSTIRPKNWDYATYRIKQNAWMIRLLDRVMQTSMVEWPSVKTMAAGYCVGKGMQNLAPTTDEKRSDYERRLRTEIEKICRPVSADEPEKPKKSVRSEPVNSIGEFLPKAA